MYAFKNILVYANGQDGGREAFSSAIELLEDTGGRVTLAGVIAEGSSSSRDDEQKRLTDLANSVPHEGIEVGTQILTGSASHELIQQTLRAGHDLLIKSGEQSAGLKERMFGSTARKLFRKCPCPVWVIKPGHSRSVRRVLAAIDAEHVDETHKDLNHSILDLASAVARAERAELHVASAWQFWVEGYLRTASRMRGDDVDQMVRAQEQEAERRVRETTAPWEESGVEIEAHVEHGPDHVVIAWLASRLNPDLVILGTFARGGLPGLLVGNIAESLLDELDCSVLAVKPAGYECPVALDNPTVAAE
ncbi:Universal stress protein E [Maioricimonas rarisocia]|uniref:Universal stress protein E n=1 Tax=Maioricimonas rarisocia TaxID=2528026 RepID=A0A517Z966_9PLAN|nr:universal stress protein [Maioricimonas rarisocia]QDU39013.1 Universal stress protein E [Maioricimonas rarisocia]